MHENSFLKFQIKIGKKIIILMYLKIIIWSIDAVGVDRDRQETEKRRGDTELNGASSCVPNSHHSSSSCFITFP